MNTADPIDVELVGAVLAQPCPACKVICATSATTFSLSSKVSLSSKTSLSLIPDPR